MLVDDCVSSQISSEKEKRGILKIIRRVIIKRHGDIKDGDDEDREDDRLYQEKSEW